MIAQSMAREYGPQGIHVAHVIIDGGIDGERLRAFRPQIVEERGVALGEPDRLQRILRESIAAVRLCASDPLCAEHEPVGDGVTLHGAACHACLFASETSCERGNKYLDRTLLAQTFDHTWPAFFGDVAK